jgi:RNA polymerase sigma-70 factor (ECF subfamily)
VAKNNKIWPLQSDEMLMQELIAGRKLALEILYDRYFDKLVYFACGFIKNQQQAEDIVQEVFIKLIEQPQQFNPSMRFSTWVFTLTANRCKNNLRDTQNRNQLIENHVKQEAFELNSEHDLSSLNQSLNQGIEQLSLKEKTIYKLRFEEEMSLKEIAETIDIPIGSVKSGLFHLLKKLAIQLSAYIHE